MRDDSKVEFQEEIPRPLIVDEERVSRSYVADQESAQNPKIYSFPNGGRLDPNNLKHAKMIKDLAYALVRGSASGSTSKLETMVLADHKNLTFELLPELPSYSVDERFVAEWIGNSSNTETIDLKHSEQSRRDFISSSYEIFDSETQSSRPLDQNKDSKLIDLLVNANEMLTGRNSSKVILIDNIDIGKLHGYIEIGKVLKRVP